MSFRFQQFYVADDRCAMKVGTDGVLLGSWVSVRNACSVVDVGTGSGLIGLMLAQRTEPTVSVLGIEIEESTARQAAENFQNSPWSERMTAICRDFKTLSASDKGFDLIVSNPPYFSHSLAPRTKGLQLARHDDALTLADLIGKASELLSPTGRIALIIPSENEPNLLQAADLHRLYPVRKCYVRGTVAGKIKRLLIELTRSIPPTVVTEELALEQERHRYTEEYRELTKEFYL